MDVVSFWYGPGLAVSTCRQTLCLAKLLADLFSDIESEIRQSYQSHHPASFDV